MINFEKAPMITKRHIEFMEDALSTDHLLDETKKQEITGLEALGFIKGAQHALGLLRATNNLQENG